MSRTYKISIITPLYRGGKYINALLRMIQDNVRTAGGLADVEWIISNDCPVDYIDIRENYDNLEIIVLNTDRNRGIHGARVRGLNVASGDYILFLDQDDTIYADWIRSQTEKIGEADAIVCDGTIDGSPLHDAPGARGPLEECITIKYNIEKCVGFIPGQVLIKKDSIPGLWKERILRHNCCDDYYLWILMLKKGCTFTYNKEKLYCHNNTNINISDDVPKWIRSTLEMVHILYEERILDKEEMTRFIQAREAELCRGIDCLYYEKQKLKIYKMINDTQAENAGFDVDFLRKERVAIYGFEIGCKLSDLLRQRGIEIVCIVDKRADEISSKYTIVTKEELPNNISLLINTLVSEENKNELIHDMGKTHPEITIVDCVELF